MDRVFGALLNDNLDDLEISRKVRTGLELGHTLSRLVYGSCPPEEAPLQRLRELQWADQGDGSWREISPVTFGILGACYFLLSEQCDPASNLGWDWILSLLESMPVNGRRQELEQLLLLSSIVEASEWSLNVAAIQSIAKRLGKRLSEDETTWLISALDAILNKESQRSRQNPRSPQCPGTSLSQPVSTSLFPAC